MLDKLEKILQEMGVKYQRRENDIICSFQRERGQILVIMQIQELSKKIHLLQAAVPLAGQVAKPDRTEAITEINNLNLRLPIGQVILDTNDGEIIFKWSIPLRKEPVGQVISLFLSMLLNFAEKLVQIISNMPWVRSEAIYQYEQEKGQKAVNELLELTEQDKMQTEDKRIEICRYIINAINIKRSLDLGCAVYRIFAQLCHTRFNRNKSTEDFTTAEKCYLSLLEFQPKEKFAREFGAIQNNLGNLYLAKFQCDYQDSDFESADRAFLLAIEVRNKKNDPDRFVMTQNNRGLLYKTRFDLTFSSADFDIAKKLFLETLESCEPKTTDYGTTKKNLANLYLSRFRKMNSVIDFNIADEAYISAIDTFPLAEFPFEYWNVQNNRGELYLTRFRYENNASDFNFANEIFSLLKANTKDKFPGEFGIAENRHGNLYQIRYERENSQSDFEIADNAFQSALEVNTKDKNPAGFLSTQLSRGNLFLTRFEREKIQYDFNTAKLTFELAWKVTPNQEIIKGLGMVLNNFGNLYLVQFELRKLALDFDTAANLYRLALEIRTKDRFPREFGVSELNLGHLHSIRFNMDCQSTDFDKADKAYLSSLEVLTTYKYPTEFSSVQISRGNLYCDKFKLESITSDFDIADMAYTLAIEYFSKDRFPANFASIQNNRGLLYLAKYDRTNDIASFREAQKAFQVVLEPTIQHILPSSMIMNASSRLAMLEIEAGQIEASLVSYDVWLEASTNHYLKGMTEKDRLSRALEDISFSSEYARKLLECRSFKESLVVLDTGKARQISQIIGLEAALTKYSIEEKDTFKTAQNKVRAAEFMLERSNTITKGGMIPSFEDSHVTREEDLRSLAQARKELSELADQLGLETSVLRVEDLRQTSLPVGTAAVEILLGEESSIAFIWEGKDRIRTIELPDLSWNWLKYILSDLPSQVADWVKALNNQKGNLEGWTKAQEEIASCSERVNAGLDFGAGWYYLARLSELTEPRTDCHTVLKQAFANKIQATLKELEKRLWALIREALDDRVKKIILVPPGLMGLLPLSVSSFEVTIVPSLYTWLSSQKMVGSRQKNEESIIVSPVYSENELLFAPIEARWIKRRFEKAGYPTHDPLENQATILNIKKALKTVEYFHFSGHGFYNWNNPFESYLVCKGGELTKRLSVKELMKDGSLDSLGLCVMSACSSGVIDAFSSGEEFIGLPGAMLQAGVPAIVASLWSVDDLATMFLMDEFYRLRLKKKMSISGALKEASQWLRQATRKTLIERIDENGGNSQQMEELRKLIKRRAFVRSQNGEDTDRPFASPIYWAAFAAYGNVLE